MTSLQHKTPFIVTKQQQLNELNDRITPVVNVDIIIHKDERFLVGYKNGSTVFPGGRMKFDETIEEAIARIGAREVKGVKFSVQKLVTCLANKGYDARANGVTLYYLCQYEGGEFTQSDQLNDIKWLSLDELLQTDDWHYVNKLTANDLIVALASANSSEDEMIVQVDENDTPIGKVQKRVAHTTSKIYHRSTQIIVINDLGEVVLQQRSEAKSSGALKWDLFGGHVKFGSSPEVTAAEELQEELGVAAPLHFIGKQLLQADRQSEFMYIYSCHHNGPYNFDRNEVARIKAFDIKKIIGGEYDSEFDILPHAKQYLELYSTE